MSHILIGYVGASVSLLTDPWFSDWLPMKGQVPWLAPWRGTRELLEPLGPGPGPRKDLGPPEASGSEGGKTEPGPGLMAACREHRQVSLALSPPPGAIAPRTAAAAGSGVKGRPPKKRTLGPPPSFTCLARADALRCWPEVSSETHRPHTRGV